MKILPIILLASSIAIAGQGLYDKFPDEYDDDPWAESNRRLAKIRPTQKELAEILKRAKSGDAETQYRMGQLYEHGDTVPHNLDKAVEWYEKAAKQGHKPASDRAKYHAPDLDGPFASEADIKKAKAKAKAKAEAEAKNLKR